MSYGDAYSECAWVDFDILESFMTEILIRKGVPEKDAAIVSEVLITADKRGIDSHGIGRFKTIYIDRLDAGILNPVTKVDVIKETPTTAVLDGNNGMGHVISVKAMDMAINKAGESGIAMVAVRNTTHYGIAGYYVMMATECDMIGITGTNARPSIAPTFGVENMLGTNPLTFGLPTDEEFPFVIDCATSIAQRGKIEAYARTGKKSPPGWVIDNEGETETDPSVILKGLIAGSATLPPLGSIGEDNGGYKGYGYATVVEILSSALQDGKFMKDLAGYDEKGNKIAYPLGHFFIAVNPDFFMGKEIFKSIAGSICRELRNSRKMPGFEKIYTAGEKEHAAWQYRKEHGCPVPESLQRQISELRDIFQLDYTFKWD